MYEISLMPSSKIHDLQSTLGMRETFSNVVFDKGYIFYEYQPEF